MGLSWGQSDMFCRQRTMSSAQLTPITFTSPCVTGSMPEIMLMIVVLPEPLCPRSANSSFDCTARLTSSTAL